MGRGPEGRIEKRQLGKTGESLSILGFGGMIVNGAPPEVAASRVAEAFDRGINYFDVAPLYGNAQERLGPALRPYRDRAFLACKTLKRDAAEAERDLNESLRLLQTDHFDLYQLHSLKEVTADVDAAFASGGAMEAILRAREAGKIRFIGYSAHSEEAALAAMERFDFDTILFPMNFEMWRHGNFGPRVHARAKEKGMGILALKGMARTKWPAGLPVAERKWKKCWYEPWEAAELIALHMRFTLNLPATAMIPPGHWELFKIALEFAERGNLPPLSEEELALLDARVAGVEPLFAA